MSASIRETRETRETTETTETTQGQTSEAVALLDAVERGPSEHYLEAMLVALDVVSESLAEELAAGRSPEFTARRVHTFRNAWLEARRLVARRGDATERLEQYLARVG